MTSGWLRNLEGGVVLAGVKAKPFGWPTASLDPGCGRHPRGPAGPSPRSRISNFRSSRFQGIAECSPPASMGRRRSVPDRRAFLSSPQCRCCAGSWWS